MNANNSGRNSVSTRSLPSTDPGHRFLHSVVALLAILLLSCPACAQDQAGPSLASIKSARETLRPLHHRMGPAESGDWLKSHREPGQTLEQYLAGSPVTPTGRRRIIYLLPLGDFGPDQQRIVKLTGEYLGLCYNRPVRSLEPVPLSAIPATARRVHPTWDVPQVLTTWLLDELLPKQLPADGAALIALTSSDLWPGEGWNFVFGQASLDRRVGVWSIHRNGDPAGGEDAFRLCLRRTLKTASHELGHMFSIQHCTAYECNMCGSNNRPEADRRPLPFCPECAAKIWWATQTKPGEHYRKLAEFCQREGLTDEARFFKDSAAALSGRK